MGVFNIQILDTLKAWSTVKLAGTSYNNWAICHYNELALVFLTETQYVRVNFGPTTEPGMTAAKTETSRWTSGNCITRLCQRTDPWILPSLRSIY